MAADLGDAELVRVSAIPARVAPAGILLRIRVTH